MCKILEKTKQFFIKRRFLSLVFLFGAFFLLASVLPVSAQGFVDAVTSKTTGFVVGILGSIASIVVNFLGLLISLLMTVLVAVAQYNDFINSQAVINGWVIVRDLCNMFFIVILLVIAFSVILRIDGYDIKKMIPKLLIMAVLINFSKTICGLIIDAGQIIMLTFVASFKDIAGGNFTDMLGIKGYLTFGKTDGSVPSGAGAADNIQVIISYAAAIIFLIISLVVIVALLSVLVMRIIMLWIYVVLSPLAFFLASFPQGKGYSQKWWKEFTEAVIVGPVLAFFLWLSFVSLGSGKETFANATVPDSPTGLTEILTGPAILKYVVSIGMLLGGLVISQSMAGQVGGAAGKAMGRIQAGAGWAKKNTIGRAKTAAIAGGAAVGGAALASSKIALGTVDKLAGSMVGGIGKKVGLGRGQTLTDRGLVGGSIGMAMAAPANMLAKVKDGLSKNRTLNDNIYQAQFDDKKEINHNGKKYQPNTKGEYQRVNEDGSFAADTEPNAYLADAGGKRVTTGRVNSVARQAWHGALRSATSGSRAASEAVEEKRVDEEMKKIKSSGMSNQEARRKMTSAATTVPEKKALAMHLANEKGFDTLEQKQQAEKALGGNSTLVKKFGDTVVKNQVHLAYNLEAKDKNGQPDINVQASEKERLAKDLGKGNIDVRNLPKEAINNSAFIDEVHNFAGDAKFGDIMAANAQSGGKKNQDNVVKALSKKVDRTKLKTDKFAKLQARISGDISVAFNSKQDGTGKVDVDAVSNYLASAKTKDLESVDNDQIEKLLKSFGGSQKTGIQNAIGKNVSYAQLKSIYKSGNQELAKRLRDEILNIGGKAAPDIRLDNELSSL